MNPFLRARLHSHPIEMRLASLPDHPPSTSKGGQEEKPVKRRDVSEVEWVLLMSIKEVRRIHGTGRRAIGI